LCIAAGGSITGNMAWRRQKENDVQNVCGTRFGDDAASALCVRSAAAIESTKFFPRLACAAKNPVNTCRIQLNPLESGALLTATMDAATKPKRAACIPPALQNHALAGNEYARATAADTVAECSRSWCRPGTRESLPKSCAFE